MPPLDPIRQFWEEHAQHDPLWAILSDGTRRGGTWDPSAFFATGVVEVGSLLRELEAQGIAVNFGSALDFGCGVGRLTQAIAPHFERTVGVDISRGMLALAAGHNQFPDRVSYVVNESPDLRVLQAGTFDFVITHIVLQHLPPEISIGYLREFFRVLAPAGILVFQLPSHRRRPVAMPDEAYRASLAISGIPERAIGRSQSITIDVAITNDSTVDWSRRSFGLLRVGNHWLEPTGRSAARDDGRTSLPGLVTAGTTCHLPLTITAPDRDGAFECEVDVAHEGILWFQDRGSPAGRISVRVEGPRRDDAHPGAADTQLDSENLGGFPMNGMSVDRVVALITGCGGALLHIENDHSCGDDWLSYRYFVRTKK